MSELKMFSLGMVLKDKEADSWEIEAKPIESNGFSSGTVDTEATPKEATGTNAYGETYSDSVQAVSGIIAKWYPDAPNRTSAPDVHMGETVELWRYADSDQIYWRSTGQGAEKRTTETIIVAASNKPKADKVKLDATNSYFMEMCTRTKKVTLKTSKSNGEAFAYTVQINTADSAVIIEDDAGNLIQLDSETNTITFISAAESSVEINENITFNTQGTFDVTAKGGINMNTDGAYSINAKSNYKVTASTYVVDSSNMKASGGAMDIIGGLTNNGTNVGSSHKHTEQGDGQDVSTPH